METTHRKYTAYGIEEDYGSLEIPVTAYFVLKCGEVQRINFLDTSNSDISRDYLNSLVENPDKGILFIEGENGETITVRKSDVSATRFVRRGDK